MTLRPVTRGGLLAALIIASPGVLAFPNVLASWQNRYPDSLSDDNAAGSGQACTLCHNGDSFNERNPYAYSLAQNGFDFAAVEALDADGDGNTNLEEILADTQPGWTLGDNNRLFDVIGEVASDAPSPAGILGDLDPPQTMVPVAVPTLQGPLLAILSLLLLSLGWRRGR